VPDLSTTAVPGLATTGTDPKDDTVTTGDFEVISGDSIDKGSGNSFGGGPIAGVAIGLAVLSAAVVCGVLVLVVCKKRQKGKEDVGTFASCMNGGQWRIQRVSIETPFFGR
jgi:hypothetical protein